MPSWHCRHTAATLSDAKPCEGPRHGECGLRYAAGEFWLDRAGALHLQGIPDPIRIPGLAQLPPRNPSAVIVWQDTEGWNAEFVEPAP